MANRDRKLGENIKRFREESGISATALAAKARISKSYLSELENPKEGTKKPSADVTYKIAKALGVPMSDLLGRPIINAAPTEAPTSLLEFKKKHPEVPQGDIEMLTRIKFRGEQPKSVPRWEFIYEAIKNSEAMDG